MIKAIKNYALTASDTFSNDGKVTTDLGWDEEGNSVLLQTDGKILIAGSSYYDVGSSTDFADFILTRYNPTGSLDTSFGMGGFVTTDFGGDDYGSSAILQPNGKIMVAGYSYNGNNWDFSLLCYNPNGLLDTSFSEDGKVTTDFGGSFDFAECIALQADGKILLAGQGNTSHDFTVARYNINGSLDTSFSNDGKLTTDFGNSEHGYSITVQPDGKILVGGASYNHISGDGDFALVRYNTNGSLDTSFNTDGFVTTDFGGNDYATSIILQSDAKILLAGSNDNDFVVARYNTNGSLDTSFNTDGFVTTDFGGDDYGTSITLQPNGKILVAGVGGSQNDFAMASYNTDGSPNTGFSSDGKVTTDFGSYEVARSVSLQSDGNILVAGYTDNGENLDSALARYNPDGTLNTINNREPTGSVIISGTAFQGQTLTASNTLADADGLGSITYQWQADGIKIGTGNNYTLTGNEVGKIITVTASYTDLLGTVESKASTATSAVLTPVTPAFIITNTDSITGEDGDTATISMQLATSPTRDVAIVFTSSDGTEGTIINPTITFNPTNWSIAQSLTIVGKNDYLNDGNQPYIISAAINSNDVNYRQIPIDPMVIINREDITTLSDARIPTGTVRDKPLKIYGDAIVDTNVVDVATGLFETTGSKPSNDILQGLDGNDTFYGGNLQDDLSGGIGDDILYGENDEDFLYGGDGNDLLYGQEDNDSLEGGNGNDTLDGGLGIDTLVGGTGNDTYYLNYDAVDVIYDQGGATDIDVVIMPYQLNKYTLPKSIERGTIAAGTKASSLTGNTSNNALTGNDGNNMLNGAVGRDSLFGGVGNDVLIGGAGNDTLSGGTGKDIFKFNTALTANTDKVTDFVVADDTIQLENAIFTKLKTTGVLSVGNFVKAAAAADSDDYVIYNPTTGGVTYDADGTGAGAGVQIALLGVNLALTNADFVVI